MDIPQVQFLVKVYMPVVVASGADGQTMQKTLEMPQMQFLVKVVVMPVWWHDRCRWSRQC